MSTAFKAWTMLTIYCFRSTSCKEKVFVFGPGPQLVLYELKVSFSGQILTQSGLWVESTAFPTSSQVMLKRLIHSSQLGNKALITLNIGCKINQFVYKSRRSRNKVSVWFIPRPGGKRRAGREWAKEQMNTCLYIIAGLKTRKHCYLPNLVALKVTEWKLHEIVVFIYNRILTT